MDKAIYRMLDHILMALNDGHKVWGIFCDLEKAFDCVNHKVLLSKLEFCGISGLLHKLITPYLERRFQRIRLQSKYCNLNTFKLGWNFTRSPPRLHFRALAVFYLYQWSSSRTK
jgi:hypothetical protein